MKWLSRYPAIVNAALAFLIALLASLWCNYWTASEPMTLGKHLPLFMALGLLAWECWFNVATFRIERKIIKDVLKFGIHYCIAYPRRKKKPGKAIGLNEVRAMVHLVERTRPGPKLPVQQCLVPHYWVSEVPARDVGPIPVEVESYQKWYVNVQAFRRQQVVAGEPTQHDRPCDADYHVSTPSQFKGNSVISAPIWSRGQPRRPVGTLTFDSTLSLRELEWMNGDQIDETLKDALNALADLVERIISND